MIKRYTSKEISDIWSEQSILDKWLKVEILTLEALKNNGVVSVEEFNKIILNVKIDVSRWKEIEKETHHEFASFVRMLEEKIPDNCGRWIHYGLTSSDVLDTALSLCLIETLNKIDDCLLEVKNTLKNLEVLSFEVEMCGRTHGQVAERQLFSDVVLRWIGELDRNRDRLVNTLLKMHIGKISGPVGNYSVISKDIEQYVCDKLGICPAKNSSQIISRDIYADYFYCVSMIASFMEKVATYIRLLAINGIDELSEKFDKNQVGSSAMPHKRNPILCENICGISRMIKSYLITAIDNNNSWLERDMSHSSVERITLEDSAQLTYFGLKRLNKVLIDLNIDKDKMKENLSKYNVDSHRKLCENIKNNSNFTRKENHIKLSSQKKE